MIAETLIEETYREVHVLVVHNTNKSDFDWHNLLNFAYYVYKLIFYKTIPDIFKLPLYIFDNTCSKLQKQMNLFISHIRIYCLTN